MPPYPQQLRHNAEGAAEIYCSLRRKWVALTPEEWVRQLFVSHLIHDLGYPASLMGAEVSVKLNGTARRCDTVVWRATDGTPLVIVEYKAPSVPITQRVFDQIARYNMVLRAPYLMVSNGLQHYCCRVNHAAGTYAFLRELPPYSAL